MNINQLIDNAQITVLIGKNGCGKSTLLRKLDERSDLETKYISPERGGTLKYDPSVDNTMSTNAKWIVSTRRRNRFEQFRQQSTAQFRNLETLILREIEKDHTKRQDFDYTFDTTLDLINELLPAIKLVRSDRGFSIASKNGEIIDEDLISSGESELISLAIEALVFSREDRANKILLLDEPDVHLHPDLQHKLVIFLRSLAEEFHFKMIVATHSTAIFGGLSQSSSVQVVPIITLGQIDFKPFTPNDISKQILPVFGAHPLANHFNASPIMLVEGEDDRRVIDQMVRSSNGRFKYSPAVVKTVNEMSDWEGWLDEFLPAIYDEPKAFSLRDLDNVQNHEIDNLKYVSRARLNCYAIENILLTDDCFVAHDITADQFKEHVKSWVDARPEHQCSPELSILIDSFDTRRTIKVKDVRNVLCALLGSNKPWEVVVGQLLANCDFDRTP